MVPDPETLRSNVQANIEKNESRGDENGSFASDYLADSSVAELLQENESVHYLLVSRSDSATVEEKQSDEEYTITSDQGLSVVAVVTDRRVIIAAGKQDGDLHIELPAGELTDATLSGSLLTKTVTFETTACTCTLVVKKRSSSGPSAAVEYVREQLVPVPSTTTQGSSQDRNDQDSTHDGAVNTDDSAGRSDGSAGSADHPDESTEDAQTGRQEQDPASLFILDQNAISDEARTTLRETAATISCVDTSDDNLNEAANALSSAAEHLESVCDEPGVDTDAVTEELDRIEDQQSKLKRILSARATAEQKLALVNGGMSISETDRDDVLSTIEQAIDAAEELDRESTKLEEYYFELADVEASEMRNRSAQTQMPTSASTESSQSTADQTTGAETDKDRGRDEIGTTAGTSAADSSHSEVPDEAGEPHQETLLAELERVAEKLGKRPTTSEFDTQATYDSSDVYDYFDSWGDAIDAASIETATRDDLLDDLHRLETKLGYIPLSSQVEEHGQYSAYDYRQEFGSVQDALNEAGLNLKERVMETLHDVVTSVDGKPKMADFEEASDYSSGVIYKFFESWDDAVAAATPDDGSKPNTVSDSKPTGQQTKHVEQNELSERYELLRNLRRLVKTVVNLRQSSEQTDPMVTWQAEIEALWTGSEAETESYGSQQSDRNPFSMRTYRDRYGNGERVTEFECVRASPVTPSLAALLEPLLDQGLDSFYLPVDPETDYQLPVIIESEAELERATRMLHRLPATPSAASHDEEEDDEQTQTASSDLTEVNGVTTSIAESLSEAGFHDRQDLEAASMEGLAGVDGVSEQLAMRIKLDVGD